MTRVWRIATFGCGPAVEWCRAGETVAGKVAVEIEAAGAEATAAAGWTTATHRAGTTAAGPHPGDGCGLPSHQGAFPIKRLVADEHAKPWVIPPHWLSEGLA
jgi:hypothetical protein